MQNLSSLLFTNSHWFLWVMQYGVTCTHTRSLSATSLVGVMQCAASYTLVAWVLSSIVWVIQCAVSCTVIVWVFSSIVWVMQCAVTCTVMVWVLSSIVWVMLCAVTCTLVVVWDLLRATYCYKDKIFAFSLMVIRTVKLWDRISNTLFVNGKWYH